MQGIGLGARAELGISRLMQGGMSGGAGAGAIAGLGSLLGAGVQAGASIYMQGQQQKYTTEQNILNMMYQQQLQGQVWSREDMLRGLAMGREDSAIQRRTADLEKAGLSPVLAAGQPAQAQQFKTAGTQRPEMKEKRMSFDPSTLNSLVGLQQLGLIKANVDSTRMDIERKKAMYPNEVKYMRQLAAQSFVKTLQQKHDYTYYKKHQIPSNTSNRLKTITGAAEVVDNFMGNLKAKPGEKKRMQEKSTPFWNKNIKDWGKRTKK